MCVSQTERERQLRAVKEAKGGGHTGAMTGAMVGTAIVFFPAAAPEVQSHVINLFAETGAKAIVTNAVPSFVPPEGWSRIARTNYYVYLVSKPNRALSGTALKRG